MNMEGVGERWIVYFGKGGFFGQLNPMTLIMSFAIMITLVLIARKIKFERIPGRVQGAVETFFDSWSNIMFLILKLYPPVLFSPALIQITNGTPLTFVV
jgi:hypothetical protein